MFARDLTDKSWLLLLWQMKASLPPAAHLDPARDYYPVAESAEENMCHVWRA